MLRNRLFALLGLLVIASMVLAACGAPASSTDAPADTTTDTTAATDEPAAPAEPKVMVACLAQEPSTLYLYSESALVKTFVLEALYDNTFDARTYDYQGVLFGLSTFDDTAVSNTIEVGVGDVVYDGAQDAVVTLEVGTVISLNQAEGDPIEVTVEEGQKYPVVQIVTTHTLAEGATWEDGTPVTTADVEFSYNIGAHPDTPSSKYFYETQTQKIEIVDDTTYKYFYMPSYTSGTYFVDGMIVPLPKHVWRRRLQPDDPR